MKIFKLISRNALRRKLRTFLTILGLALAVMAFGLIRAFIDAWYAGEKGAVPNRMVTRHAVSIIFDLPLAYKDQILKIDGVEEVTYANWFGGYYVDPKNFFPQFAVDQTNYFKLWPEFIIQPAQFEAFCSERNAAIVGRGLADRFGWKVGDKVTLIGTVFHGSWDFNIRGIYSGKEEFTDETLFFMRWDYLDEWVKKNWPGRDGHVGWYGLKINDPGHASEIGAQVDARFKNSYAETKTETEKEFQRSFIEMASTVIKGLQVISYLIIGVILLVLVNTMVLTARERVSENAFMKTIGFRGYHLVGMIMGESLFIAFLGGVFGMILLYFVSNLAAIMLRQWFPFSADITIYLLCLGAALLVGFLASIFPIHRALKMSIVDGLRVVD